MKVLRLYDYLGQLKKELNIFVEGEDFKWTASYPEAIWLGTISLEDAGKEPEPVESYVPVEEPAEPESKPEFEDWQTKAEEELEGYEKEPEIEEVENEPKKVHRKRSGKSRTHPSDYLKSIKVIRQDDSGADTN